MSIEKFLARYPCGSSLASFPTRYVYSPLCMDILLSALDPGSEEVHVSFWDGWGTTYYTAVKSKQVRTFDEVKAYCDQFGMRMPVPKSKNECKELGKLAERTP